MSKPVTVVDVAHAAGVAVGTVSRVFNHHPNVNDDARTRVFAAAQKLGYKRIRQHRRSPAAALEAAKGNIGVIIFGMEDTLVHLPVIGAALHGVEHALSARGENLMLANIPRGNSVPAFLRDRSVRGLILKGPNQGLLPPALENELLSAIAETPHVWLMGRLQNATGDHCNFDTDAAGALAVAHLFEQGHRRIAFLNPKPGHAQFDRLRRGFQDAVQRLGLKEVVIEADPLPQLTWPLPAITSDESARRLVDRLLRLPPGQRPTAVFSPADRASVQLYGALAERGLQVPRDLSIVSCNNEAPLIGGLSPQLTTVDVHAEFVGRCAVEQLCWRINHPEETLTLQTLVEPHLVVRQSVARPA